jgi:hypothetical protein
MHVNTVGDYFRNTRHTNNLQIRMPMSLAERKRPEDRT